MRLDHLNGSAPPKLAPELKFRNSIFFQQITFLTLFLRKATIPLLQFRKVGAYYQIRFRRAIFPIVIRIITILCYIITGSIPRFGSLDWTDPFRSFNLDLSSFDQNISLYFGEFSVIALHTALNLVPFRLSQKKVIFSLEHLVTQTLNLKGLSGKNQTKKFVNLTYQVFWQ